MIPEELIPIVSIFGIFIVPTISIAVILFYQNRNKSRERLAMIEKGIDLTEVYRIEAESKKKKEKGDSLQTGLIAIGAGVGLLFGKLLSNYDVIDSTGIAIGASVTLFVGVAYIVHYVINSKKKKNDAQEL